MQFSGALWALGFTSRISPHSLEAALVGWQISKAAKKLLYERVDGVL